MSQVDDSAPAAIHTSNNASNNNSGNSGSSSSSSSNSAASASTSANPELDLLLNNRSLLDKELAKTNIDAFASEKQLVLNHLKSKLSNIAYMDLLSIKASNLSILQNEETESLSKLNKDYKRAKSLLKQQTLHQLNGRESIITVVSEDNSTTTPTAGNATTTTTAAAPMKRTRRLRKPLPAKVTDEATAAPATKSKSRKRRRAGSSSIIETAADMDASQIASANVNGALTTTFELNSNEAATAVAPAKKTRRKRSGAVKQEGDTAAPVKRIRKIAAKPSAATTTSSAAGAKKDTGADADAEESKPKRKRAKRKPAKPSSAAQDKDKDAKSKEDSKDVSGAKHNKTKAGNDKAAAAAAADTANKTAATTEKKEDPTKLKLIIKAPKLSQKEIRAIKRQYDNVYLNIWKDMARKDGPRIHRLVLQSQQAKLINLKKTALLAARESSKWKVRTNKNLKDLQTKARRSMREMFNFWKKNEREERDLRKRAEKEAIDLAKKQEEEREAQRQSRKLNFLLTQTELYSHFIGKKIKTDEIEGADKDANLAQHIGDQRSEHHDVQEPVNATKNDINTIDFDNEDEEALKKKAAENAQSAVMAAKARADEFNNQDDENEMNFQNPTSLGDIIIDQPKLLTCTLKEYQVKGLNWLANLYDKGINGILADEMGLGKTVQSISTLAYLAETHNIWGPFLVVTPASTLHNWQQELTKFVPDFKVLPYWGNAKDRKVLRKFWDRKSVVYNKDSPFHVLVTSYQLVVADAQYFQKIKWQYMILDEAQAIKSSQSSRWKILLGLQCRNRLLLTGTPIQNSMQELWALLHFIMPSLFDSHDEFSEWFSKDIENHATTNSKLNEAQLRRLHMILKPFMLRRIKKNVQKELGDKVEIDVFCDLTTRQKRLYQILKSQISLIDILENAKKGNGDDSNLMNLVMQFRKVCNHPDLFERADTKSSFNFGQFADTVSFLKESNESVLDVHYSNKNVVNFQLPNLIYDELIKPNFDNSVGIRNKLLNFVLNIWNEDYLKQNISWIQSLIDFPSTKILRNGVLEKAIEQRTYSENTGKLSSSSSRFLEVVEKKDLLTDLLSIKDNYYKDTYMQVMEPAAAPKATAPLVEVICSNRSFVNETQQTLYNPTIKQALSPLSLNTQYDLFSKGVLITEFPKAEMMPEPLNNKVGYSTIRMPSMNRFITESGKLAKLDQLLVELQKNDHRVLVYFQMTKMMDLMEEYLTYRQYKYIRLDGSSKLDDRRDLVHDWQTKPEIFVFLLSTRAGGLGINLTAADTVIFYDSDWNPTIDSQAMDRAHRLGQTKQVTVYRLVVRGTIEERMRDRAKQKEHVQQVVMEGKADNVKQSTQVDDEKTKKEDVAFLLF